jgi:hypothetical protein
VERGRGREVSQKPRDRKSAHARVSASPRQRRLPRAESHSSLLDSRLKEDLLKDGKVALAGDAAVVVDKGMGILHRPPAFLVAVLGDADAERRQEVGRRRRVLVERLRTDSWA